MNQATVIRLGLVIAVLGVYGKVLGFDFIEYDDTGYVTRNPEVQQGLSWEGLRWAFTTLRLANWHPLTWLSHQLDVTLFGLDPSGHHAVNVLFHALNVVLLFGLLHGLTGALWRSAAAAAIFALHPLQVESVAWIAERKNLISTLFWLLACRSYLNYARSERRTQYALTIAWMAIGLMCKPALVTLPFALLLLDYWPLGRIAPGAGLRGYGARITEKLPLFVLAIVFCVITWSAQQYGGALEGGATIPLYDRLINALVSYALYLWRFLWPFGLSVYYPHPNIPGTGGEPWALLQVAAAASTLIACTTLVAISRRRYAVVGWLWFLGTLVPMIGVVQTGTQAMADRYAYVPIIGLSILLCWGGHELLAMGGSRRPWPRVAAALVLSLYCGIASWQQLGHWRNSLELFSHALALSPRNTRVLVSVGVEMQQAGRLDEAIRKYRTALEIRPEYPLALMNLGTAFQERGDPQDAIRALQRATAIDPTLVLGHYNLANALAASGNMNGAVAHYRRTLELDPENVAARVNLGSAFASQGELVSAMVEFRRALELDPQNHAARKNLDLANQQLGQR